MVDGNRIDRIAKSLASPRSRRSFFRTVGGAIGGALAVTRSGANAGSLLRGVGSICRKHQECASGVCGSPDVTGRSRCVCPTGLQTCGTRCVDPTTAFLRDAANCGACGVRCTSDQICCNGSCVAANAACGGSCCTPPQVCHQSACCLPEDRSVTCSGKCGPHINNCGQTVTCDPCCKTAGQPCASNTACCSGVCVNGTCAAGKSQLDGPCDETADCASGVCCAGFCTDPATFQTDLANCGSCGTVCPAAAPECGVAACVSGFCGGTFAPSGTTVTAQIAGDCKKNVCNGAGQIVSVADEEDRPLTANACLTGACSEGQPALVPKAAGTGCSQNGGSVCDGSGNCVVCLPNSIVSCYTGPTGTLGVGVCTAGTRTCNLQGSGYWPCTGEITPGAETTCNGADDDCDGAIDNGVCPAIAHGTSGCIGSGCGILSCDTGYEDCNGSFDDGCETHLGSDPDHCGACDNPCPASTPCATVSCVAGTCQTAFAPHGTELATQTTGDCRRNVCDGQGGETTIDDNDDSPGDDGTGCTTTVCSNGFPSEQNKAAGSSCGENGDWLCTGDGACVECLIDADCASDVCLPNNACCQQLPPAEFCAGQCGTVVGTCQTEDCGPCCVLDGDPCGQNSDCCSEVCLDGACIGGPRALGESCDEDADCTSGACCGAVCVDPASYDDDPLNCGSCGQPCGGEVTECSWPVCIAGACGTGYADYGTPLESQTAGDCRTDVCDGAGGTTFVIDNDDAPEDDGIGCSAPICDGGSPATSPRTIGTPCDAGYCDGDGLCVECVDSEHCASGLCEANNTCCVPDGYAITCDGLCGPQTDNCGLPVDCDPCCVPDDDSVTCDGQCGDVLNNCDVPIDCGPCGCPDGYETGSDGVTCVPTEETCNATLDAVTTSSFDADFRECSFAGYEFGPRYFVRADFSGANLAGASFIRTNLSGSNFTGANLTGVAWALAVCPDDYPIPANSGEKCCGHLDGAVPAACT